ncbi:conserved hypothetical protein, secreted [Candidatus Omnitrophus magneticus]|uniref:HEAT repeat domain-containing protein n=1 Tax=Candidatus Omnitrophus magneticus TaxID=1609969 RepID=A0A0F0CMZ6_9BACT|nr:conserved hypothetical protein, secreted [Candidatus Omnitrophus magneticus]
MKKVTAIVLLCFFAGASILQADINSGKTVVDYKFKKLVKNLYDKTTILETQRQLATYGKSALPFVAPLLADQNNEDVRVAALWLIGNAGDASYEDNVIPMLTDRENRVRREAGHALSKIGTQKSIAALKNAINDNDAEVRFYAMKAFSRVATQEEIPILINAISDFDARVRKFAVIALGRLKSKEGLSQIAALKQDSDSGVRFEAVRALGEIGGIDTLMAITPFAGDPEIDVKVMAVNSIAKIDNTAADTILEDLSGATDPRVASTAIRFLGERKSSNALLVARKYIGDEHMEVRLASIEVFKSLGTKEERKYLEPLLTSESSEVRKYAQVAIETLDARI